MPAEVSDVIVPILESYIASTSVKALSLGLIISLWPASNVFNAVQRILNTIFKAEPRKNALISRGFAYVFTLASVSYTHLTLPTIALLCRSRWSPYH